jgi:hypothetical protein
MENGSLSLSEGEGWGEGGAVFTHNPAYATTAGSTRSTA